jgi:hypothetical protein
VKLDTSGRGGADEQYAAAAAAAGRADERLEDEVGELQRVEEVLIAREGAERSTNCAPAAALGVRVADAHGVRAA